MNKAEFLRNVEVVGKRRTIYDINELEKKGIAQISKLPFCIKVLTENLLRKLNGVTVKEEDLIQVAQWKKHYGSPVEIPFHPSRVLAQDFTGVPAVVDLAAMRDAMVSMGGDPRKVNPQVPVDLIIDHSVQVDFYGTAACLELNAAKEFERNEERYALLKWAQQSFENLKIVPPRSGICHQVNLEYLSQVFVSEEIDGNLTAYPETLVGTDSHTTTINGIGVIAWGVGGIEAEGVMLGQPYYMAIPEVIGVKLTGRLKSGVSAMDLTLFVTQKLRNYGVVEKFVEYFGPGVKQLSIPDRATLANMAPEYGATVGFLPVDESVIEYLKLTNRQDLAEVTEASAKLLGLFNTGETDPEYTDVIEVDLDSIEHSVAGPSRPHQRIPLKDLKKNFSDAARESEPIQNRSHDIEINGDPARIGEGSVVMAAITSCTNTCNPYSLIGAGLVARNAVKRGLRTPPYVKTVLALGSKVVARYLNDAGLTPYLEALGFHLAGFGCMTCIGNSGPLHPDVERVIKESALNVAAVISGNRNFEARIHPLIKSNFLASPMLVIGFALAGNVDIDFQANPIGIDPNGKPIYLHDIWPEDEEIEALIAKHVTPELFDSERKAVFEGDEHWKQLKIDGGLTFAWDERSTYIKAPPYFEGFTLQPESKMDISGARVLALLGDSVTTDHISPAGSIPEDYPAGRYLSRLGVKPEEFNSYGARRGNHQVMMRGTFGNIRLENKLASPKTGGFTKKFPEGTIMHVYDAAVAYEAESVPLLVIAGREYGAGSSRDWAAKGACLLGVKAVLAESFERIHRSNLVGMGALPLVFPEGESFESLGLDGSETYYLSGVENIEPRGAIKMTAIRPDDSRIEVTVTARLDTAVEVEYFKNSGILWLVLRNMLKE